MSDESKMKVVKNKRGGKRPGAGRPRNPEYPEPTKSVAAKLSKSKAEDRERIIELMNPLEQMAYKALMDGLKRKTQWAVKLWLEYRFGKPTETKDVNVKHEQPLFEPLKKVSNE